MKKRIVVLALALVMALSLAVPAGAAVPLRQLISHDEAVDAWYGWVYEGNLPSTGGYGNYLPYGGCFLVDFDQDTIPELVAYYSDSDYSSCAVVYRIQAENGSLYAARMGSYPEATAGTDSDGLMSSIGIRGDGSTGYLVRFADGQYGLMSHFEMWHFGEPEDKIAVGRLGDWGFTPTQESYTEVCDLGPWAVLPGFQDHAGAAGGGTNAGGMIAYPSTQKVDVDGVPVEFQMYALKDANGYDTNYVKLRDAAYILNGSGAQFSVEWDQSAGCINLVRGKAYGPNGSEMYTPFSGEWAYEPATAPVNVNGVHAELSGILLKDEEGNGYTYYKLRDLGQALGFTVDWSSERGVYVETKAREEGYDESSFAQRWTHNAFLQSHVPGDAIQDDYYDPYNTDGEDTYVYGILSGSVNDFIRYETLYGFTGALTFSYGPAAKWSWEETAEFYRQLLHVLEVTPDIGLEAAVADFMEAYSYSVGQRLDLYMELEYWADGTAALNVFVNGTRTSRSYDVGDMSGGY